MMSDAFLIYRSVKALYRGKVALVGIIEYISLNTSAIRMIIMELLWNYYGIIRLESLPLNIMTLICQYTTGIYYNAFLFLSISKCFQDLF